MPFCNNHNDLLTSGIPRCHTTKFIKGLFECIQVVLNGFVNRNKVRHNRVELILLYQFFEYHAAKIRHEVAKEWQLLGYDMPHERKHSHSLQASFMNMAEEVVFRTGTGHVEE